MSREFAPAKTLERKDVEDPCIEFAHRRGWWHTKVGAATRNAQPDDLFVRAGVYVWVEFKRPGEEPTAQQFKRHRDMRAFGMDVRWTSSVDEFKRWFR